ncbi:phage antirepressor [Parabacteroides chongii]|uniref:phage antirepressor n=1 Tax=Parabacteroides chongii TaxID=2685834 RepID=UPI00240D3253|nr:phage antirepressor [Parabacteroides chongii]WFE84937.1 phage antirepressor [Parabacteroides chongii]
MNGIEIFKNERFGEVRVAGTSENPLFCLADVCKILGLRVDAVQSRLTDAPIRIGVTDSIGREQQMNFVNEKNLYKVIMRSDKPQAEPFQDWVCGEVLPSIRKHGAYMTNNTLEKALTSPDFLIQLATNLKEEQQKRIEAEQKIQSDAPKVLFADAVSTSRRSCLIAELAKILQQNGIKIGQNRLFEWLRKNGYLCQKGQYYNQPSQKSMELGLFEIKQTTINKPDGSVLVSTTTKVTGKGQIYFVYKFLNAQSPVICA